MMDEAKVLLNAYYELLYEKLLAGRGLLVGKIERLLQDEVSRLGCNDLDVDKYAAYKDACLAFVDERLETYNPIGIQYTFDRARAWEAFELELQLNWYDSQAEFEALIEQVNAKAEPQMDEEKLRTLAQQLIEQVGAFPDKSIISAYEAEPALGKMPDYLVARAIEEIIR